MLCSVRPDGRPHAVPITHVVVDDRILFAIDHKPKTRRRLQRLVNIESEPRVSVLFDHRSEDWTELWWARADGTATVSAEPPDIASALVERHAAYDQKPPAGPWIIVSVDRWQGWIADRGGV